MKKNKIKALLIAAATVAVSVSFLLILFFNCSAYDTICDLKTGNKYAVENFLSEDPDFLQEKIFLLLLPDALGELNQYYNEGEISESGIEDVYITLRSFNVPFEPSYQKEFEELSASKKCYKTASTALNQRLYTLAIENYEKVIQEDSNYENACQELQEAKDRYKRAVEEKFYTYVLDGETEKAEKILQKARTTITDAPFDQMERNLNSDLYEKICIMLNKNYRWENITQAHAGNNSYRCYKIKLASNDYNVFECYYVSTALTSLIESGNVVSIGGPVAWYRITEDGIEELSYSEETEIEAGGYADSVDWNHSATRAEKFKALEELFN